MRFFALLSKGESRVKGELYVYKNYSKQGSGPSKFDYVLNIDIDGGLDDVADFLHFIKEKGYTWFER